MDFPAFRRQSLLTAAKADGVDAYVITQPANIAYLTGLDGLAALVLTSRQVLIVPGRNSSFDESAAGMTVHQGAAGQTADEATADAIRATGAKTPGVEAGHLSVGALATFKQAVPAADFRPIRGRVEARRQVKDPAEVEEIRAAVRVAERGFRMLVATVREADTEKDLADSLDAFTRRAGGRDAGEQALVAVGARSALPRVTPGDAKLSDASKVLVDFRAAVRYRCRLVRTCRSPFPVAPVRRTKRERTEFDLGTVYREVSAARTAAVEHLRDGVPVREAAKAARAVLDAAGLGEYADRSFGHGIGLEAIEGPDVSPDATGDFRAGMVVCLSAGVRVPDWGAVRVADPILVTRDGGVPITSSPANLDGMC